MMGKRNAYALAARLRKAGAHGGSRRPQQSESEAIEEGRRDVTGDPVEDAGYTIRYLGNTIVDTIRGELIFQDAQDGREHHRCYTCGNESCSVCGQMFRSKPLHIFWGECICEECQQPDVDVYWGP